MNKLNDFIQLVQTDKSHVFNVKLTISGKSKFIGVLDESSEGTFIAVRKEKHLFRMNDSLGVNYELLSSGHIPFKWIVIDYCGQKLISTREYFLHKGKVMQFNKQGYELQILVPIREMNIHTARKFEAEQEKKRNNLQSLDLFNKAV